MKIRLHEIEFNVKDPEASKHFYNQLLGIPLNVDQEGLKCFDAGWPGIDLDASVHNPGKVSISFLVDDIDAWAKDLRAKDIEIDGPVDSHLGMRSFDLEDPDGYIVRIQSPTENSPQWLRDMIE